VRCTNWIHTYIHMLLSTPFPVVWWGNYLNITKPSTSLSTARNRIQCTGFQIGYTSANRTVMSPRWHTTHLCSFPISSIHSTILDSNNPNNQSINLGGELVPFLYVEKVSTSVHHTCIRFLIFYIDLIFKRNSRQSNSNPWKVFFRQVYKPLGRLHILSSTHITFYSQSAQQASKSTLKCVRYWSSSASSCWPSHLLVMFNSMY
jgi:hypothetical protein